MRAHNKLEESGEALDDTNDGEMEHPGVRTRDDHVSGRMREEGRSAAAPAAARANRSHGLAVGEPEYSRPGSSDNVDLADYERDRRQHRRHRPSRHERIASGYSGRLNHLPSHRKRLRRNPGRHRS